MTLAPQSASWRTAVGPARTRVRSSTVKRDRASEACGSGMVSTRAEFGSGRTGEAGPSPICGGLSRKRDHGPLARSGHVDRPQAMCNIPRQCKEMAREMGDVYGTVKVAAVQAASVFLDREGSTEKACRLIREAGGNGARVIGFPEGFIPGHPVWYHHHAATAAVANELAAALFRNSLEIPGSEIDALAAAARDAKAYVVIGVCEKLP